MKKLGNILGIVFAVAAVLVIALVVLAKILITPERVRETVLPLAQEALHREVALGDIEVSLFSGIALKDLVIREREGEDAFIEAKQMVLRYRFWPLLFGRVIVDQVRLDGPTIRVARLEDQRFNFSDLAGAEKAGDAPEAVEPKPEDRGAPIDLLVSEVAISGGQLLFLDFGMKTEAPYRYKLSNLEVAARDISLDKRFPFSIKANINGSALAVEGEADIEAQRGKVKINLAGFDLTAFAPYFRDQLPGKLGSLKVSLDLTAEGGPQAVDSSGSVALNEIDLVLDAMKDAPLKDTNVKLDYAVKADLAGSKIQIDSAKAMLNGIQVNIAGKVENYATSPVVDVTVGLPDLDLRNAIAAVPKGLVKDLDDLNPAGVVNARLHLAGSTAEPVKLLSDGDIRLDSVQATAGGVRPALSGLLVLKSDAVSTDNLQLTLGDNQAIIKFRAANLTGKPMVVSSTVTADRFLLDPLLKTTAGPAAVAGQEVKPARSAPAEEIGPFDLPLRVDGTVEVKQAIYQGLAIDNFAMHFKLADNVLTIDKLQGDMAGGTFNKQSTVDLRKKGLAYSTQLAIQGVKADPFVAAFVPKAAGTVFGTLDLNGDFSGSGTLPEAIRKNLSGQGKLLLADGKLTGAGLVQGLADYLNLEELRVLRFQQAKSSFTVKNGKINLNSEFAGNQVRAAPTGTVGLDGSLDVALDARLAPELTQKLDSKGTLTKFLKDQEGWAQVPLKVTGTATSPSFALDTSAVEQQVKEKAREKIEQKLQEKIFDKLAPSKTEPGAEPAAEEPAKKMLKDTLKGFFGN